MYLNECVCVLKLIIKIPSWETRGMRFLSRRAHASARTSRVTAHMPAQHVATCDAAPLHAVSDIVLYTYIILIKGYKINWLLSTKSQINFKGNECVRFYNNSKFTNYVVRNYRGTNLIQNVCIQFPRPWMIKNVETDIFGSFRLLKKIF